mgnify:CR=1 FL=1
MHMGSVFKHLARQRVTGRADRDRTLMSIILSCGPDSSARVGPTVVLVVLLLLSFCTISAGRTLALRLAPPAPSAGYVF